MKLIAWRHTGKNPCVNPPVTITIATIENIFGIFPWVLLLERAIEIFGQEVVDKIGEEPVRVHLTLEPSVEVDDAIIQ